MTNLVRSTHIQPRIPSDVMAWEVYEYHSRDINVVTSSTTLEIGTVLAFDSGTNAYLPITAATISLPLCVLIEKLTPQVEGSSENFKGQCVMRTANLKDRGLIYPAIFTAAEVDAMVANLLTTHIKVQKTV